MKEACYAATAALDYAKLHVEKLPQSKVLVIASDIAKYGSFTLENRLKRSWICRYASDARTRVILAFNDE